jgi:hypothetical protein
MGTHFLNMVTAIVWRLEPIVTLATAWVARAVAQLMCDWPKSQMFHCVVPDIDWHLLAVGCDALDGPRSSGIRPHTSKCDIGPLLSPLHSSTIPHPCASCTDGATEPVLIHSSHRILSH